MQHICLLQGDTPLHFRYKECLPVTWFSVLTQFCCSQVSQVKERHRQNLCLLARQTGRQENIRKKQKYRRRKTTTKQNPNLLVPLTPSLWFHSQVWAEKKSWSGLTPYISYWICPHFPTSFLPALKSCSESLIQQKSIWFSSRVSFQPRSLGWSNSLWGHAIAITYPEKSVVRKRGTKSYNKQLRKKVSLFIWFAIQSVWIWSIFLHISWQISIK